MRKSQLALLGAALAGGCVGEIAAPDESGPGPVPSTQAFVCKSGLQPPAVALRRLSRVQLTNTVSDLVLAALPEEGQAILAALEPQLSLLPADHRDGPQEHWGGFTRVDQRVTQEHVDRSYELAVALGKELTGTPARLAAVAGSCATGGADEAACLDNFLRTFGERALRRPITDEDVAFYAQVAGAPPFEPDDWADVIAQLAAAPEFLYFVENGDAPVGGDFYEVSAYELASRLSFHFWQSAPDDHLLGLARSGELLNDPVFRQEVDRVFADPRTRQTLRQFYDEWFRRGDLAQLNALVGTPAFDTLRGELLPTTNLRAAMFDEVGDMAMHYTLDQPGQLEDFFTSRKSFARSEELAALYGVPAWDGTNEPPDFVEPARVGLLTRAAMVATGSANTRPIMKGVFVRRALLCDDLLPPPANVMATTPQLAHDATSREVVEALTAEGSCAGCHEKQINPLGFVTENFDALGRSRTEEILIDLLSGEVKGTKPVNTVATPHVTLEDASQVKDGVELQAKMLESGKVHACFARVYFRFTYGRSEDEAEDGCTLADMDGALRAGTPLRDVLHRVALSPAFKQRNFAD